MGNNKTILTIIILAAAIIGFYFINQNQTTKPQENLEGVIKHIFDDPNMSIHNDQLVAELSKLN